MGWETAVSYAHSQWNSGASAVNSGASAAADYASDVAEDAEEKQKALDAWLDAEWGSIYSTAGVAEAALESWLDATWGSIYSTSQGNYDNLVYEFGEGWKDLLTEAEGDEQSLWDKILEYFKRAFDPTNVEIDETTQKILDNLEREGNMLGDIIANNELGLGFGFDFAMMALGGLPELLTGFKTDLSEWFHFDITEFFGQVNEMQAKLKEKEAP